MHGVGFYYKLYLNIIIMSVFSPAQEWRTPSLQLIDLGCAIDMSLFPEGTTFREVSITLC